jgi:hypothetical protein
MTMNFLQKRNLFASCCALLLLVTSSLASDDHHKQQGSKNDWIMPVPLRKQEQRRNMPGGYFPVDDYNDARVVNAANVAVSQLLASSTSTNTDTSATAPTGMTTTTTTYSFAASLQGRNVTHTIVKAFQQVVAGMNFRFVILLQDADNQSECLGAFAVTVYDNFGTLQVTAWGKNLENAEDFESATGEHFNGSS